MMGVWIVACLRYVRVYRLCKSLSTCFCFVGSIGEYVSRSQETIALALGNIVWDSGFSIAGGPSRSLLWKLATVMA
jgi:predicted small integral membrane protein